MNQERPEGGDETFSLLPRLLTEQDKIEDYRIVDEDPDRQPGLRARVASGVVVERVVDNVQDAKADGKEGI